MSKAIDLDKLEALERQATPEPWEWTDEYKTTYGDPTCTLVGKQGMGILSCDGRFNSPRVYDEELIIALRNAAPALFAELRAARERIAELERDARLGAAVRGAAERWANGTGDLRRGGVTITAGAADFLDEVSKAIRAEEAAND